MFEKHLIKKIQNCETGHFNLSKEQKKHFSFLRELINNTHPMKSEFRKMLEEKLNANK